MNATLLIHAIVRQTTVLIAALATSAGKRAQLASIANLVFADLVRELREHGLANKVIADMFGMALRTYHRKLARLSASRTVQGKSLWEAVLAHIQQCGPLLRSELLQRFAGDDEATLHSVVLDLVESGLVRSDGTDDATRLAASDNTGAAGEGVMSARTLEAMLIVALHRGGPLALEGLAEVVPAETSELEAALTRLVQAGLVTCDTSTGQAQYACETYLIPFGDDAGWEAAVLDHYQAMVVALVTKLRGGKRRADLADCVGGSTFVFDLWRGHPLESAVLGYLRETRERGIELRKALAQHDAGGAAPAGAAALRVTAYVGQSVMEDDREQEHV
jgi:hypothetical protein